MTTLRSATIWTASWGTYWSGFGRPSPPGRYAATLPRRGRESRPASSPDSDLLRFLVRDRVMRLRVVFLGEEADRLKGRHTSHARGRDGLPVDVVGHVAGGPDALDRRRRRARLHHQIAALFGFQLAGEQF